MEVNTVKSKINVDLRGARMVLDQFNNVGSDSFFSTFKPQANFSEDNEQLHQRYTPLPEIPSPEELPLPYTQWTAQEDPYQLMNCALSNVKNRSLMDVNDWGSEADLYGLVSNILEEADQMDSCLPDELVTLLTQPNLKAVWSPKPTREDSLKYFRPEVKMQPNSSFQVEQVPLDLHGRARETQLRAESYQHFNGLDTNDPSWLMSCTGDAEGFSLPIQDLPRPPGLDVPPAISSTYLSKNRAARAEYMSGRDETYCGSTSTPSSQMDGVTDPCRKLNDSFFSPYPDYPSQNRANVPSSKPFSMQDANRLGSSMQALLLGEQDSGYGRDLPQNRSMAQRPYESCMAEQNIFSPSGMSGFAAQMPHFKKEMSAIREGREGDVTGKRQPFHSDYTSTNFVGFGQQHEYFQPPTPYLSSHKPPTPHPNKEASHRGNGASQMGPNRYAPHPGHSRQYQSQLNPTAKCSSNSTAPQGSAQFMSHSVAELVPLLASQQSGATRGLQKFGQGDGASGHGRVPTGLSVDALRRSTGNGDGADFDLCAERSRQHAAAFAAASFLADGRSAQGFDGKAATPPAGLLREPDRKQGLLQNPYLEAMGGVYGSVTTHGPTGTNPAKPQPPPLFPCLYRVGEPRQGPCHLFPPRPPLPYGSPMPLQDLCDVLPEGELPAFNPYLQELKGQGGDGMLSGLLNNLRAQRLAKQRGGSTSQLHYHLEECYEQWRMLEKERKKAEVILAKSYPGKRVTVGSSAFLPKVPPNPSRVDRLIVDQLREQAKVLSLLGKMERLRSVPLHANICSALDRHLEIIYITQARRKDEFSNSTGSKQRQGPALYREDRDVLLLAAALKDLSCSTRRSRTALWSALQMTLPKSCSGPREAPEGHVTPGGGSPGQAGPERVYHAF